MSQRDTQPPLSPEFQRLLKLLESDGKRAWLALTRFVAISDSHVETQWLLEEFVDKHGHDPVYLRMIEAEIRASPAFAAAIADMAIQGSPSLAGFLKIHRRVRRRLGLDPN